MHISSNQQHIAVVIDSIKEGGGAEKNAVRLARLLKEAGHQVTLLTFNSYPDEYAYAGTRVSFAEEPQRSVFAKVQKAISRLFKIKKFCKESGVTHIISFLEEANAYTLLARLLLRNQPRLIVSVRADPHFASPFRKRLIRVLYRYADTVVAVSKAMEEILRKDFGLTKTTTIYNPVDVEAIKEQLQAPLPAEYQYLETSVHTPVFINVGRLRTQKGQIHLINSFAKLHSEHPSALLIIIGEGPERTALEQAIAAHSLQANVLLVGQQANIYPFMRITDCFVLPSLFEGFPNVLLEAAASGLYIISTDCPTGPREILVPEKLNDEIEFPYRVSAGSLLPAAKQTEDFEEVLFQEMVWFVSMQKTDQESLLIARFSEENFLKDCEHLLK